MRDHPVDRKAQPDRSPGTAISSQSGASPILTCFVNQVLHDVGLSTADAGGNQLLRKRPISKAR